MPPPDMSSNAESKTLGVDLASQPADTAVCLIEWVGGGGRILDRESRALTDDVLGELLADPSITRVGIDAPFGWPTEFVEAVASFNSEGEWPTADVKRLEFRETDLRVAEVTGRQPLSVTTDWLVWAAWRCARLLTAAPDWGPTDRRGDGRFVEVYPAAALQRWGLNPHDWSEDPGSYKGTGEDRRRRRERIVEQLAELCPSLSFEGQEERFVDSDDELDALIAALVARLAETGRLEPVPDEAEPLVLQEGWIRLPAADGSVADVLA